MPEERQETTIDAHNQPIPAYADTGGAVTSGRKATNWLSGETLTFRRTSVETAGELVELDLELRPLGAPGGLPHRHVVAEHFEFAHDLAIVEFRLPDGLGDQLVAPLREASPWANALILSAGAEPAHA